MKVVRDCVRASFENLPLGEGYLFTTKTGQIWDSRDTHVIHNGLDTVRQLYNCLPDFLVYSQIQGLYDQGFGTSINLDEQEWKISHGGRSGYRYKLHNDDLGIIVFVGSTYMHSVTTNGPHLKIQCSPVFLLSRTIEEIDRHLMAVARLFADQVKPSGVAVHICADVQGWIPPNDLDSRITTRARRIIRYSGINNLEFDANHASISYGKGETFLFGKADSLQFTVYNKGKAVKDKNEIEIWLPIWSQCDNFDIEQPIYRLEARFHHSVVQQFANGRKLSLNSVSELAPHLNGLWRYALNNFRLDESSTEINPVWQYLRDDVCFYHLPLLDIDYQRKYQASKDGQPTDRSLSICFGQLTSIYRRRKLTLGQATQCLVASGIYDLLVSMYLKRGGCSDDVILKLAEKLESK